MVFRWNLRGRKSPQVSRTLVLAELDNVVVWRNFPCPLISKSSSSFTNPLGIFPNAPITIDITITSMFYIFCSLARSQYLSFFLFSFNFTLWSARMAKSSIHLVLFFFFVDYHLVWSTGGDKVIHLYLLILENFYYYNHYCSPPCEFFPPVLSCNFPLKFE